MPKITVVVPTYNGARFIGNTLESLRRQEYEDWEAVIVDDGSTDHTLAVVESFAFGAKAPQVIRQKNSGVAAARNAGLAAADPKSQYVAFLDHDDVWSNDALTILNDALDRDPQASAAYGLARYIDSDGALIRPGELERWGLSREVYDQGAWKGLPDNAPLTVESLALWGYIKTPGQVLFRKSALDQVAPFDQAIAPCDDWDIYFRIALLGHLRLIRKVVLDYRLHEKNATHDETGMRQSERLARHKFAQIVRADPEKSAIVLSAYRYLEEQRLARYRSEAAADFRERRLLRALAYIGRCLPVFAKSRWGRP